MIDENVGQLRRRLGEIERKLEIVRTRFERQLRVADSVHRSLLPQPVRHERILVDVRYIPVEEVGGDYCQVRFSDPDTCYVTMCDVTGHGIGPALLATRVSSEVRQSILYGREPRDVVRTLNHFICDHFEETHLYLTFIAARIDLSHGRVIWSGAGHPSPILIRSDDKKVELLESQNVPIGVMRDCLADEPEHTIDVKPGDRLLFYTDGLSETVDAEGRYLLTEGLTDVAQQAMAVELFDMADYILDRIDRHQHGPATDDKTLIVAQIL
jgi:sigma-B regulation protein RsbU (phosphoserine phosphatase)